MKSFTLNLLDATRSEQITGVVSFVGEDDSGSFGILAGHARFLTCLVTGLARFRLAAGGWKYLAVPGAALYFHNDLLTLSTRRFLVDEDYMRITDALQEQLMAEEEKLRSTKESLHRMEENILKRLWQMGRGNPG